MMMRAVFVITTAARGTAIGRAIAHVAIRGTGSIGASSIAMLVSNSFRVNRCAAYLYQLGGGGYNYNSYRQFSGMDNADNSIPLLKAKTISDCVPMSCYCEPRDSRLDNENARADMHSELNKTSLITDPHLLLPRELIDLNIDNAMKLVIEELHKPPSVRFKLPVVTVRGMGGGKTRAFEELRRRLIVSHPEILTLGITFNNNTELDIENNNDDDLLLVMQQELDGYVDAYKKAREQRSPGVDHRNILINLENEMARFEA
jgi:hypothetical protein